MNKMIQLIVIFTLVFSCAKSDRNKNKNSNKGSLNSIKIPVLDGNNICKNLKDCEVIKEFSEYDFSEVLKEFNIDTNNFNTKFQVGMEYTFLVNYSFPQDLNANKRPCNISYELVFTTTNAVYDVQDFHSDISIKNEKEVSYFIFDELDFEEKGKNFKASNLNDVDCKNKLKFFERYPDFNREIVKVYKEDSLSIADILSSPYRYTIYSKDYDPKTVSYFLVKIGDQYGVLAKNNKKLGFEFAMINKYAFPFPLLDVYTYEAEEYDAKNLFNSYTARLNLIQVKKINLDNFKKKNI